MEVGPDQKPPTSPFESAFDVGAETLAYQIIAGVAGFRMSPKARHDGGAAGAPPSRLRQVMAWLGFR
jgi:hypothetical protein